MFALLGPVLREDYLLALPGQRHGPPHCPWLWWPLAVPQGPATALHGPVSSPCPSWACLPACLLSFRGFDAANSVPECGCVPHPTKLPFVGLFLFLFTPGNAGGPGLYSLCSRGSFLILGSGITPGFVLGITPGGSGGGILWDAGGSTQVGLLQDKGPPQYPVAQAGKESSILPVWFLGSLAKLRDHMGTWSLPAAPKEPLAAAEWGFPCKLHAAPSWAPIFLSSVP